jgi:hypothetical protein
MPRYAEVLWNELYLGGPSAQSVAELCSMFRLPVKNIDEGLEIELAYGRLTEVPGLVFPQASEHSGGVQAQSGDKILSALNAPKGFRWQYSPTSSDEALSTATG